MPRRKRSEAGGCAYHVLNRAVLQIVLFETPNDYQAFESLLRQALQRFSVRLIAYCAMPNHWHLVVWPSCVPELSRFMQWFTMKHAQRWHATHGTAGHGAVYQGRFKAVGIESDEHFLVACRYVERNALASGLVSRAEDWRWSSVWRRHQHCEDGILAAWPLAIPDDWLQQLNRIEDEGIMAAVRTPDPDR